MGRHALRAVGDAEAALAQAQFGRGVLADTTPRAPLVEVRRRRREFYVVVIFTLGHGRIRELRTHVFLHRPVRFGAL